MRARETEYALANACPQDARPCLSPARGRGFAYHGFRRRIGRSACGRGKDRQTDVATNRRNGKAGIIVVAGPDAPEGEAERIAARVGAPLVADGESSDEGGPLA